MSSRFLGLAALAAATLVSGQALAGSDPTGVWMNDTGRGAIEIKPCGDSLCGNVVWVKDTSDTKGCGRQIIGEAKPAGSNTWDNGWIYSPERKKKYDVELKPLKDGRLQVMGYAGTKLFSKTMIWTPAPTDLVRCSTEQAATVAPAKVATTEPEKAPAASALPPAAAGEPKKDAPPAAEAPANDETADDSETADGGSEIADALGEFLKKGPDGKCKLDLPWVKVNFDCEKKGKE